MVGARRGRTGPFPCRASTKSVVGLIFAGGYIDHEYTIAVLLEIGTENFAIARVEQYICFSLR